MLTRAAFSVSPSASTTSPCAVTIRAAVTRLERLPNAVPVPCVAVASAPAMRLHVDVTLVLQSEAAGVQRLREDVDRDPGLHLHEAGGGVGVEHRVHVT